MNEPSEFPGYFTDGIPNTLGVHFDHQLLNSNTGRLFKFGNFVIGSQQLLISWPKRVNTFADEIPSLKRLVVIRSPKTHSNLGKK